MQELDLLNAVQWRVSSHTPHQYLDQFIHQLTIELNVEATLLLRTLSDTLIDMCCLGLPVRTYLPVDVALSHWNFA